MAMPHTVQLVHSNYREDRRLLGNGGVAKGTISWKCEHGKHHGECTKKNCPCTCHRLNLK